jgi:hypothetical protein
VVVALRTKPFPSPVSLTVMPAITAPPESCTVPDSEQETFWAGSMAGSINRNATYRNSFASLKGAFWGKIISQRVSGSQFHALNFVGTHGTAP